MRQYELAQALDISPAMVSKLARRGMPTDDIDRAKRWRKRHLEPSRIKGSKFELPTRPAKPSPKSRRNTAESTTAAAHAIALQSTTVRLAQAANAAMVSSDELATDLAAAYLAELSFVLRWFEDARDVPPLPLRVWLALTSHGLAEDSPARGGDLESVINLAEFGELVKPGVHGHGAMLLWIATMDGSETAEETEEV